MTQTDAQSKPLSLGQRLQAARRARGISITKLAYKLDVDPRTVARWQADETMPSIVRLGEIARVLEKPPSYFLDEEAA